MQRVMPSMDYVTVHQDGLERSVTDVSVYIVLHYVTLKYIAVFKVAFAVLINEKQLTQCQLVLK